MDKVVVVERSGEYLKTHAEDSEALFLPQNLTLLL